MAEQHGGVVEFKSFVKSRTTRAIFWLVVTAVFVVYSFSSFVFIPFASAAWLFMLIVLTDNRRFPGHDS